MEGLHALAAPPNDEQDESDPSVVSISSTFGENVHSYFLASVFSPSATTK